MKVLDASALVKRFKRTAAIDGVSLTVDAGEHAALLGANGVLRTVRNRQFRAHARNLSLRDRRPLTELAIDLRDH